jgi:pilus assembly protein CpaC
MKLIIGGCIALLTSVSLACFAQGQPAAPAAGARDLNVMAGKSVLVDSPAIIERVSVANGAVAEAMAITPHEVMVNGLAAGQTSLIVWQQGGNRLLFDLNVLRNDAPLDAARREMARELGNEDVTMDMEGGAVFLHGVVKNLTEADRAMAIASTVGKPVNLLRVSVPPTDAQILLKVRFADVDRSATQQLGINLFSTGATNTVGGITTGQFAAPTITPGSSGSPTTITLSSALNLFLFRPDLNLGAVIAALQARSLAEILAEPNVLAINGQTASFLEGGQFPYPTVQGGANIGAVTIAFREFGVRLTFTPVITPRGTIRLHVEPEVSSLDFANGLTFQGYTIPALDTRRVSTEIELEDGQSFAIAGLLDNRDSETFNKIPGLGDIPFFGKLFKSRQITKSNTELLVMVTPQLVRPIPRDKPKPALNMPGKFLPPNTPPSELQTPGPDVTGPVPPGPQPPPIPVEELMKSQQPANQQQSPVQYVPIPVMGVPQPPPAAPAKPSGSSQQQER